MKPTKAFVLVAAIFLLAITPRAVAAPRSGNSSTHVAAPTKFGRLMTKILRAQELNNANIAFGNIFLWDTAQVVPCPPSSAPPQDTNLTCMVRNGTVKLLRLSMQAHECLQGLITGPRPPTEPQYELCRDEMLPASLYTAALQALRWPSKTQR